jgi:hypothetical protein
MRGDLEAARRHGGEDAICRMIVARWRLAKNMRTYRARKAK